MRYGGRDSASQDSYLNLDSLELALKKGLELHEDYQAGKIKRAERPKPFSRENPLLVERTFARNVCVECHLIGDFQLAAARSRTASSTSSRTCSGRRT